MGEERVQDAGSRGVGAAMPGRLTVVIVFMIQFIALLLLGGGLVPYYHEQGVNSVVLGVGALAAFAALQVVLGFCLKAVPVRCTTCRGRSRFLGFGWWPFIYRFGCSACGVVRRMEVGGRA